MHLLEKDIERYGLISVTGEGLFFYANPHPLMLTEDREFAGDDNPRESRGCQHLGGDLVVRREDAAGLWEPADEVAEFSLPFGRKGGIGGRNAGRLHVKGPAVMSVHADRIR